MNYKSIHILTSEEVGQLLQEAWNLSHPQLSTKKVADFKLKECEILESTFADFFYNCPRFSVETPSAQAILKSIQTGDSNRNKTIPVIAFYVLLRKDLLNEEELQKLSTEVSNKNMFSDYPNRVKVLISVKEYLNETPVPKPTAQRGHAGNRRRSFYVIGAIILLLCLALVKLWPQKPIKSGEIYWEIVDVEDINERDTKISIAYDLSGISYREASLNLDDGLRLNLSRDKGTVAHTYNMAHLKRIILTIDGTKHVKVLYIPSKRWSAYLDMLHVPQGSFLKNGVAHVLENPTTQPILSKEEFYIRYIKTDDFDFDLDDISFETRVKNPKSEGGISCFDISIDLEGIQSDTATALHFNLLEPGCTSWAKLKVGDVRLHAGNYDMNPSGQNLGDWVVVKGRVINKILEVYIDDKLLYIIPYNSPLGKLKQIQVFFKGNGSLDWYKITSNDGRVLLHDTFE